MAINKVVMNTENGTETLIDLTNDTVTAESLAEGVTAHDASGKSITGRMPTTAVLYTEQTLTDEQKAQARANIGITETGEDEVPYTNLIPTATDTDGATIYNGVGYKENVRMSGSSGQFRDNTGSCCTGYIKIPESGYITVRLKNVVNNAFTNYGCGFYFFIGTGVACTDNVGDGSNLNAYYSPVYDDNGNVIEITTNNNKGWTHMVVCAVTINKKSIITVNEPIPEDGIETRLTNAEETIVELDERVTALENNNGGNGADTDNTIPDYWQTALDEGAEAINTALCEAGRNKSAFLFYSDAHWNYGSQMSPTLLKYLYRNTGMTKTFFGGDIVNNEATDYDTMAYLWDWKKQLKDLPNHHSVVGNHDDGNATNNLFSEQYVYGYLLAAEETTDIVYGDDGLYYYIDSPVEKTRYLCLDTAYLGVTTAQENFIIEALKSTPSGWHIVAVSHIWYLPDYNQYDVRPIPIAGLDSNASKVITLLDNYNARSGDFVDCGAKVEFCIGGHVHIDYVNKTPGGIPIILVETDSQHVRGEFTYTAGTTTEASVNGIIADYTEKKLSVVRVGRGTSFVVDIASGDSENIDPPTEPDEPDTTYTNLFVKSEAHNGYRLNSSGTLTESSVDVVTGFISVQPNTSYVIRTRNLTNANASVIGRLSEYSAMNESNHVVQCRPSDLSDKYYWENATDFCFPFTTAGTTQCIRLAIVNGNNCELIITLNEPID